MSLRSYSALFSLAAALALPSPVTAQTLPQGSATAPAPATAPVGPRAGSGKFERGGGDGLVWNPKWKRFTVGNGVLTGIAATALISAYAIGPNEDEPWTRQLGLDESVRDTLRAPTRRSRQIAEDASDVGLSLALTYPYLVDALIVSSWYHDSPDVGVQMALINTEAIAFSTAIQALSNLVAGRERPYGRTCGAELDSENSDCVSSNRYRSFFSGHTSLSFTAAAVNCVHHTQFPLYGPGSAAAPCVGGFVLAGGVATLRVVADVHYLTDVLSGAVVGTGVGLAVPLVLHYREGGSGFKEPPAVSLRFLPMPGGAALMGEF